MIAEAESRANPSGERHRRRHDLSRRYGRMQKPGSDEETERPSRNRAMQRPGSDEEMERPSHYHTKRKYAFLLFKGMIPSSPDWCNHSANLWYSDRDSLSSGSKKRSEERRRFQRPGDDDDADQDSHTGKHQHRREHSSSSSSSKPSWMKKEFFKEPEGYISPSWNIEGCLQFFSKVAKPLHMQETFHQAVYHVCAEISLLQSHRDWGKQCFLIFRVSEYQLCYRSKSEGSDNRSCQL